MIWTIVLLYLLLGFSVGAVTYHKLTTGHDCGKVAVVRVAGCCSAVAVLWPWVVCLAAVYRWSPRGRARIGQGMGQIRRIILPKDDQ